MGILKFQVKSQEGKARTGLLKLQHGTIKTPELMPVATKATVKALTSDDLNEIGTQILICNTYHLMLQPNADIIEKCRSPIIVLLIMSWLIFFAIFRYRFEFLHRLLSRLWK